jgi:predicted acyl esterase
LTRAPDAFLTSLHAAIEERLTTEPFVAASADDDQAPDAFAQMPASQTNRIQKLRYLSEPLAEDVTIAGPSVLNLFASIDQDDNNWIVILKDVGPDVGVQTAREGERDVTPACTNASSRAAGSRRPTAPSIRKGPCPVGPGIPHACGAPAGHTR